MLTVTQHSPSPNNNKPNPDWSFQVKVGRGRADTGAHHRAIDLAEKLFANGQWDGRGLLILHEVYDTHARAQLLGAALVEGVDYEFAEDSLYPRTAAAADEVEINGRDWQVVDRMTTDELERVSPQVAESWRRDGVVARCELRLARGGRRPYVARQYQDGSYSRPWRGSLIAS